MLLFGFGNKMQGNLKFHKGGWGFLEKLRRWEKKKGIYILTKIQGIASFHAG